MQEIVSNYFNEEFGFSTYYKSALCLLKQTINILDEFNIDYFIIAGTLLGHIRHNGKFIPWDDDIDLIVDSSLIIKLPDIIKKYSNFNFFNQSNKLIKICYPDKEININCDLWTKYYLVHGTKYTWPFIDLFIYYKAPVNKKMFFFEKSWNYDKFFPKKIEKFYDLDVSIPNDPCYYLFEQYGNYCLTTCLSSTYSHRTESHRKIKEINISLEDYNLVTNKKL